VAFFCHPLNQLRFSLNIRTDDEKCSGYLMLFQCIEDGGGVPVFISAVKGQVQDFFICVLGVPCVILRQFLKSGVACGRLPLFLETEPPAAFGRGGDGLRSTFGSRSLRNVVREITCSIAERISCEKQGGRTACF